MEDKVLYKTLGQRMKSFYEEYFDGAPENRFEPFLAAGHQALPVMLDCLESDAADAEGRTDALIAIGRIFEACGPTSESLDLVVQHAKRLAGTGFLPLLENDALEPINVACWVLGYARWENAVEPIKKVLERGEPGAVQAACWALGEIGTSDAVDVLLEQLKDEDRLEASLDALANAAPLEALDAMVDLLSHERTEIRLGAIVGIKSTVAVHKEEVLERGTDWMIAALTAATDDKNAPIAVFAMVTLAELGRKLNKERAYQVLNLRHRQENQLQN
jgi:hypothetical protein